MSRSVFGNYAALRRLAAGGMGEVLLARDTRQPSGKPVVIKRVLPHLARDLAYVDMFVAEAHMAARVKHANVVRVLEQGDVSGVPYMAMEVVHGRTLYEVLD